MRGLYVHVPFCARACPYCDFDFEVGRAPATERFLAGLTREAEGRAEELSDQTWSTVYVGGGTPSLLGAAGLAALSAWIGRRFPGSGAAEWTVEVNPEHGAAELFAALRDTGTTRVSLGAQSLDPEGLRTLGRAHTPAQARAAIAVAAAAGLRVSADLIVGWPGQREEGVRRDVAGLLAAGAAHVSVYALTIEAGTPWPRLVRRGLRAMPDADHQADMLLAAEAALAAAGLVHYEVASYARPGEESRHNLLYWTWRDYVGLGPSAHSARFGADGSVRRRGNRRGLAAWLEDPAAPGEAETLDPEAAAIEGLWTGLRDLRGLDVAAYLGRFPGATRAWIEARARVSLARGDLRFTAEGTRLQVTPGRWLVHDAISAELLG